MQCIHSANFHKADAWVIFEDKLKWNEIETFWFRVIEQCYIFCHLRKSIYMKLKLYVQRHFNLKTRQEQMECLTDFLF